MERGDVVRGVNARGDATGNRRRIRNVAAVAVLGLLSLTTIMAPPVAAPPAQPVHTATTVPASGRYLEPVFDEVQRTEDVHYRDATNVGGTLQPLRLDIYEPAGDTAEVRPVIMLIHGGFFVFGNHKDNDWGAGPAFAEPFARMGYVVVSVQYRLRPDMGLFPDVDLEQLEAANLDAYDDALAAAEWLRDHAAELRVDPRAIIPSGPSAGGAVAWNLAWLQGSDLRPEPSGVPAAVAVAGAPLEASPVSGEPLAAATAGDPPVLAFHGTADGIIPFQLAEGPCSRAAEVGVRCDLVAYEGVGHPGVDPAFLTLLGDIERRTVEFIAEVVLTPLGYFDTEPPQPRQPEEPQPAEPVLVQPVFTA